MQNSETKLPNAEHFLQSPLVSKRFNHELPRLSVTRLCSPAASAHAHDDDVEMVIRDES